MTLPTMFVSQAETAEALTQKGGDMLRCDYDVSVPGGTLRMTEHVSPRAWEAGQRQAVLLLPGPIATGAFFSMPVPGYDATAILAHAGFLCLTFDWLGTGLSSRPTDGRRATLPFQVEQISNAMRQYIGARELEGVHLVGESWGGAIASHLAAHKDAVHSSIMVSTLFRTSTPMVDAMARDPGWRAALDSLPDGYLPVGEPIWGPLVAPAADGIAAWVHDHQHGSYAAAPMYAILDIPYFDPSRARARGLVVHGSRDDRQSAADADDLAATYGGEATVLRIEGAGHIPRIEPASADGFWSGVIDFLRA